MNAISRKIVLFNNLVKKSPVWYKYYLDYLKKPGSTWQFQVQELQFKLRTRSVDKWILAENILLDSYQLEKLDHDAFDQIFDVGGNIGGFSVNAGTRFKKAKITAFEPNKSNIALFRQNIKLNKVSDRVKVIEAAVSVSSAPTIKLYTGADYGSNSTYVPSSQVEVVKNFNLLDIEKSITKKSLLKIDIEGGEIEIFKKKNLKFLKKFKMIIVEYHHFLDTHGKDEFENFLTENGFKYTNDDIIYIIEPKS
jgi:FkbM family methyltransferase